MTADQTSHITVKYKGRDLSSSDTEATLTYAISEAMLNEAQIWANRQRYKLTGKEMQFWLEQRGCKLGSLDGPAYVYVRCLENGTTREERYYRDGDLHREDGPAWLQRDCDATTTEVYFHNGKRHREDGPAYIERHADGSGVEQYYRNGEFVKTEVLALLTDIIPGVTVQRPAPKTPNAPGGPRPA